MDLEQAAQGLQAGEVADRIVVDVQELEVLAARQEAQVAQVVVRKVQHFQRAGEHYVQRRRQPAAGHPQRLHILEEVHNTLLGEHLRQYTRRLDIQQLDPIEVAAVVLVEPIVEQLLDKLFFDLLGLKGL